jgi:hypothetical protein
LALVRHATLAIGIGAALGASAGMAAEPGVGVGGYHDAALRAVQNEWLGLNLGMANDSSSGPRPVVAQPDGPSALTSFTPRFGGLGLGIASRPQQPPGSEPSAAAGTGGAQGLEVGLKDTSKIAGIALDWSAKAGVSREPPAQAGDASSFVVGGELAVSGVRFDAAYGEHATVLGVSGNRMTAGVAYGFGPVDTRPSSCPSSGWWVASCCTAGGAAASRTCSVAPVAPRSGPLRPRRTSTGSRSSWPSSGASASLGWASCSRPEAVAAAVGRDVS